MERHRELGVRDQVAEVQVGDKGAYKFVRESRASGTGMTLDSSLVFEDGDL